MDASLDDSLDAAEGRSTATPRLAEVFDAHAAYVGRTLRCLGVHERELSDAMQEVFLVVHRRLGELEEPSRLRAWLYAICVRKALGLRRKAARRREDSVAEPPEPEGDRPTPHDDLEKARALAAAFEILEGLDDDKRAIFVLYEVEQQPMSEIAETLGCPLQTAYARLYAARREVSRALARLKAKGRVER
ncbi:MAG: sigma-70 family RNA polymerase sigma factor [Sandaracinaceae bacterium]